MQDHFLFDDCDPKQRGKNCDRMGTKKDGLKLNWLWGSHRYEKKAGQICRAKMGEGFVLQAIFWHTNYEALVSWYGDTIVNWSKDYHDDYGGEVLVTRLQAQLMAEKLVVDFYNDLKVFLKKKRLIKK